MGEGVAVITGPSLALCPGRASDRVKIPFCDHQMLLTETARRPARCWSETSGVT
jgi:hypothetical protein